PSAPLFPALPARVRFQVPSVRSVTNGMLELSVLDDNEVMQLGLEASIGDAFSGHQEATSKTSRQLPGSRAMSTYRMSVEPESNLNTGLDTDYVPADTENPA
ncbi:MAG: hypothetical protein Q9217_006995, partial [Psora testacea]